MKLEEMQELTGLTSAEVQTRQAAGLVNVYDSQVTKSAVEIVKDNVCTWFNVLHFAVGVAIFFTGAYWNLLYLLVVSINIAMGIAQELHAKRLVADLTLLTDKTALVIRGGQSQTVPIEAVVMDDLLELHAGAQIVADAQVVDGQAEVNESLLTGEAEPVLKREQSELLSGSFVVSGVCLARVIHVGADNFTAQITLEAKKSKQTTSKIMQAMRRLSRLASYAVLPIVVLLFVQAFFVRHAGYTQSVMSMATALLGILPKGMELLIGVSFIAGIVRLAGKRVLTQDMYSLENLAQADTLCLDKTGTITEGKITVTEVHAVGADVVSTDISTAMRYYVDAAKDTNSTYRALQEYFGSQAGPAVITETPFSSDRKWGSISFVEYGTLVLGAPERILNGADKLPADIVQAQQAGNRLIALGYSHDVPEYGELPVTTLVATIVLTDTLRSNVHRTLSDLSREGVDIKIVSGDNPVTVAQIAKQAGIARWDTYVDMTAVQTPEQMRTAAEQYSVFGRVTPAQKRDLIAELQQQGHSVGMIGDGINDVLALKAADCSIAMNSGSNAAKQVSQFVLLESDFRVLPEIITEGQRVVNIITRVGGIFFVKNLYSLILAVLCIVGNLTFPFLPIQITLIDLVVEGYTSFLMQFEANDDQPVQMNALRHALKVALPFAVLIVLALGGAAMLATRLELTTGDRLVLLLFVTAWGSMLAEIRACWPLNLFRSWIAGSMLVGFFVGSLILQGFLNIQIGSVQSWLGLMSWSTGLSVGLYVVIVGMMTVFNFAFRKKQ